MRNRFNCEEREHDKLEDRPPHFSSSSNNKNSFISSNCFKNNVKTMKSSPSGQDVSSPTAGVHFISPSERRREDNSSSNVGFFIKRRWRCIFGVLSALLMATAVILGSFIVFMILMSEAKRRAKTEETQYLKGLVDTINNASDVRWKARFNPFGIRVQDFSHKSLKNLTAIKEYVAHLERFFDSPRMKEHLKELEDFPDSKLPRHFDAREKWSLCPSIHQIPNQGGCGSCYAVAAMTVAADRTCILSNGTKKSQLSALDVIECCSVCGNCFGGDPLKAMVYWALEGVVTGGPDGCHPYTVNAECGTPCSPQIYGIEQQKRFCRRDKCQPGYYRNINYEEDKQKGSIAYTLFPRKMSIDQAGNKRVMLPSVIGHFNKTLKGNLDRDKIRNIIRKELITVGPTTLALPLTEEFLHYDSGIFHPYPEKDFENRIIYWHVVRLIGWGHDEGDRLYWIAANSFGEQWGENGHFKVDTSLLENFGLEYEAGL